MKSFVALLSPPRTIAQRSWPGAVYLFLNALVLGAAFDVLSLTAKAALFVPLLAIGSVLLAHLGYEFVLPLQRRLSTSPVESGFREVARALPVASEMDYEQLRTWRQTFLASRPPARLKQDIEKNLHFRQTLSYFTGACIAWLLLLAVLFLVHEQGRRVYVAEGAIGAVAVLMVAVAHRSRAHALGRSYGHAYVYWDGRKS